MNTASELREATFKEFGHETRVQRSPLGTPITVPLASAALSSFCVVTMVFNEYPWFAVAGFVAAYTLFWISLSTRAIAQLGRFSVGLNRVDSQVRIGERV